jgi:hypothetical protein
MDMGGDVNVSLPKAIAESRKRRQIVAAPGAFGPPLEKAG